MTFAIHPFADMFPMISEEDLRLLSESIKRDGQRLPIIIRKSDKVLIDGRNRLAACKLARIVPIIEERDIDELESLKTIATLNISRRHLTVTQRGVMAAELSRLLEQKTIICQLANNSPGRPDNGSVVAVTVAAKSCNVSERTIRRVRKVLDKSPGQAADLRSGKTTAHKALAQIESDEADGSDFAAEAAKDDVPRDQEGVAIPQDLLPVFDARSTIRKLNKYLHDFQKHCNDHADDPGMRYIKSKTSVRRDGTMMDGRDVREFRDIHQLIGQINLCMPHSQCPYCAAKGNKIRNDCRMCEGEGWVNKQNWDSAPIEGKKKILDTK